MLPNLKDDFTDLWQRHFPSAELPLVFFFSDEPHVETAVPCGEWRCFIASLGTVRRGTPLAFSSEALGCAGMKVNAGFTKERSPRLYHFLSCGIPGETEGERYKQTPELVRQSQALEPSVEAAGRYLVAKRWDALLETDEPEVVSFFVRPDVLSGLVVLANFDRADNDGVVSPFVAGCGTVFGRPYAERHAARPRAFVGLFDPSARPYVGPDELGFGVPFGRFCEMVSNLPRSFVLGPAWRKLIKRLRLAAK